MYAVIEQGGSQHRIEEGDVLEIDLTEIADDAKKIEFDKVLLLSDGKEVKIGTPYIEGAKVTAAFNSTAAEAIIKGKKLYPTHFRRRKASQRRIGHRQKYLQVKIEKIQA